MANNKVRSSLTRAWFILNRVSPDHVPSYKGRLKFGDWTESFGDITRVEEPDPNKLDSFIVVDTIRGEEDQVTFELQGRLPMQASYLMEVAKLNCTFDIQAHVGLCKNPKEYDGGWEKIYHFSEVRPTSYGLENFGAIESGERNPTNETLEVSAEDVFEIVRLDFADVVPAGTTLPIVDISTYGQKECTECEENLVGCDTVFAVSTVALSDDALILFTDDAWSTSGSTNPTAFLGDPNHIISSGSYVYVTSTTDTNVYFADAEDIVLGTDVWDTIAISDAVISLDASSATSLWLGTTDGTVEVIESNTVTRVYQVFTATTDVADIAVWDDENVLVVAAGNLVSYTVDNGATWNDLTGPSVGNDLTRCEMISDKIFLVADDNGDLFETHNAGLTWSQLSLSGAPSAITKIRMVNNAVGYISGANAGATAGIAWRTTNGGNSWYQLPASGHGNALPTNTAINSLAVCPGAVNLVYMAGGNTGPTGVIIKGR